jgi:hypothetical protein
MDRGVEQGQCVHCGVVQSEHLAREGEGRVHHKFSLTGDLERVERPTKTLGQRPSQSSTPDHIRIVVAPAPDLALRQLLLRLGVVTEEQLVQIEDAAAIVPLTRGATSGD